jgi:hypothetical protein
VGYSLDVFTPFIKACQKADVRPNTFFDGIIRLGCGANWSSITGLLSAHLSVFILPQSRTTFSIVEDDYGIVAFIISCIIFPSIFLFLFHSDSDSERGVTTITDMYAEANVIHSTVYLQRVTPSNNTTHPTHCGSNGAKTGPTAGRKGTR